VVKERVRWALASAEHDLLGTPITIIGAGAIGGTVGAYLHDAGYAVTLVDTADEHVRAIRVRGLRITGVRGDRTFRPRIILADELRGPIGVTFLCVKGHFTDAAVRRLEPLLAADGYVVSLQNGLNEKLIADVVGAGRTVGAFVHFGADLLEPGLIRLGLEQTTYVGELDGRVTPRIEALRATLGRVMPTRVTENIWGFLWGKLVYGAMAFTTACVDATVPEIMDDPIGRRLCRAASAEAYLVASTQVGHLEPIGEFDPNAFAPVESVEVRADATLMALADAMRASEKQHMGIWRDLKVKKRKTEVDMQVAVVVATGQDNGIPTPVNAGVLGVIHEIERGERTMDRENLDYVARTAGLDVVTA
jgi:2-dehydropantoate 2-reductase